MHAAVGKSAKTQSKSDTSAFTILDSSLKTHKIATIVRRIDVSKIYVSRITCIS